MANGRATDAPVAFLGLSHLGIVTSAGWCSRGQRVVALDPDLPLVRRLERGELPVHEPGLPELIRRCGDQLHYSAAAADAAACSLVIVARDVPTTADNVSHTQVVLELVDWVLPHLVQDVVLVVMSQVPPGFTRALSQHIRAKRPDLRYSLYYWVETLIFGDAVRRTLEPERQIVGAAEPTLPIAEEFRRGLERYDCPVLTMRYESAELAKTAINLYLIASVTYANTMADLCEALGADWSEMIPALRMDRRIGLAAYIRPGLGIAGGNLERDLVTLTSAAARHQVDGTFLAALATHNENRFEWVMRETRRALTSDGEAAHGERPAKLALWGLTYKRNTRSTKNSPALRLLRALAEQSGADALGSVAVSAWDPAVGVDELDLPAEVAARVTGAASAEAALTDADALVIAADWPDFEVADLDLVRGRMRRPVVVDCVGALAARARELAGIEYHAMGRG